ncbi:hypothetical protein WJX73_008325 [Symbiochloris irregularis]|uniref:Uncharacterized protein n=1 Tax=Symbiochloris irregularis TaxID=706552 RepID=A0AAW1NLK2_9CHLO
MPTLEEILSQTEGPRRELLEQALAATTDLLSRDERQSLLKQTLDETIADLRKRRDSLPDSRHATGAGAFTQLDNVLLPLMKLQRCLDMDDVLGPYPSDQDAFDELISDVKPEDLPRRISEALQIIYLDQMETRANPVNGIVFNTRDVKLCVLVTLPVSARGRSVAAHFILDTGAPRTYIALSVLEALELPEISMYSEAVRLNGVKMTMGVSDTEKVSHDGGRTMQPSLYVGLNILGMDFLDSAEVKLEIDMQTMRVAMTSPRFPGTN